MDNLVGSLNNMRFNIPKWKEFKNKRFFTVDKPGILLLFRLALKSLWDGAGTSHIYWAEKAPWYHDVAEKVRRTTGCLSRGTQQFEAVVRPLRENCSVLVSVCPILSN